MLRHKLKILFFRVAIPFHPFHTIYDVNIQAFKYVAKLCRNFNCLTGFESIYPGGNIINLCS